VAPFDAVAEAYDRTFTNSGIGVAQRNAVWRELERTFSAGQRILEINCGSGVDGIHLASRGVTVLACDSSPRMIEAARRNASQGGFEGRVEFRVLATEELATLAGREEPARFDGALSNFAGLNCVENLGDVSGTLARLLRPGATALLCFFGRFCLWEILWYLAQGRPEKGFRRFRGGGVMARLTEGVTVRVHYPSVHTIARALAPNFRLRSLKGIGVAVPPSYLEPWARRFPRTLAFLARADGQLERCPLIRSIADHVLLTFERRS
jgi:ubiquinone/menaquinone biosynthesis C-methylase UbiE